MVNVADDFTGDGAGGQPTPAERRANLRRLFVILPRVLLIVACILWDRCWLARWLRVLQLRLGFSFPRDPLELIAYPDLLLRRDVLHRWQQQGCIPHAAVDLQVEVVPLTPKNGAMRSSVATVRYLWRGGSFEVIAKFAPSADSLRDRFVFVMQRCHAKEASFYAELAPSLPTWLPRVGFSAHEARSGNMLLLLERLPETSYREVDGCPSHHAPTVIRYMARVHASTWGLGCASRLYHVSDAPSECTPMDVDAAAEDKRVRWLQPLNDERGLLRDMYKGIHQKAVRTVFERCWRVCNTPPLAAIHGDHRIGNALFGRAATPPTGRSVSPHRRQVQQARRRTAARGGEEDDRYISDVAMIDWQAARRGQGIFDVAYFTTFSLRVSDRRAMEGALLCAYREELLAAGIVYPEASLRDAYAVNRLLCLLLIVVPLLSGEVSADAAKTADRTLMGGWLARLVALGDDVRESGEDQRVASLLGLEGAEGVQLVRKAWDVVVHARAALVARLAGEVRTELEADSNAYDHLQVDGQCGHAKGKGGRPAKHELLAEALAASVE